MKMSDYFLLPIGCGDIMRINEYCVVEENNDGVAPFDAAELAINNHDRLTEENAKLREFVKMVAEGDGADDSVKSIIVHSYIHNAKQLLTELNEQGDE